MIKKGPGVRDHRVEPDDSGSGAEKHRVDRVYAPVRRASGSTRDLTPPTRRPRPSTASPPIGLTESGLGGDTELALRRQLSRLQHQLAEAQRELAHKDDELATSVEKRVELSAGARFLMHARSPWHASATSLMSLPPSVIVIGLT